MPERLSGAIEGALVYLQNYPCGRLGDGDVGSVVACSVLSNELKWVKVTEVRVVDDTIRDAVQVVTCGNRTICKCLQLTRRRKGLLLVHDDLRPLLCNDISGPRDGRGASQDSVKQVWVSLRRDHCLPPASRASVPVRVLRFRSVELLGDGLSDECHVVDGAVGKIH